MTYPNNAELLLAPCGYAADILPSCKPDKEQSPELELDWYVESLLLCRIGAHRLEQWPALAVVFREVLPFSIVLEDLTVTQCCGNRRGIYLLTVVEVDTEESPIWQRIKIYQIPLRIFNLFPLQRQLLFCECPELPLCRIPVAGSHDV